MALSGGLRGIGLRTLFSFKQDGHTALVCAAANGHFECVRMLVELNANMDVKGNVRPRFDSLNVCVCVCVCVSRCKCCMRECLCMRLGF